VEVGNSKLRTKIFNHRAYRPRFSPSEFENIPVRALRLTSDDPQGSGGENDNLEFTLRLASAPAILRLGDGDLHKVAVNVGMLQVDDLRQPHARMKAEENQVEKDMPDLTWAPGFISHKSKRLDQGFNLILGQRSPALPVLNEVLETAKRILLQKAVLNCELKKMVEEMEVLVDCCAGLAELEEGAL